MAASDSVKESRSLIATGQKYLAGVIINDEPQHSSSVSVSASASDIASKTSATTFNTNSDATSVKTHDDHGQVKQESASRVDLVEEEEPVSGEASDSREAVGLNGLSSLVGLSLKQVYEITDVVLPFKGTNKFIVQDPQGKVMFYCVQKSTSCWKGLFDRLHHPWNMQVCDSEGKAVMNFYRGKSIGGIFSGCGCNKGTVYIKDRSDGDIIASVQRQTGLSFPTLTLTPWTGQAHGLTLLGPQYFRSQRLVTLLDYRGKTVGSFFKHPPSEERGAKKWLRKPREMSAIFPRYLTYQIKAAVLAAMFLVDFNYNPDLVSSINLISVEEMTEEPAKRPRGSILKL